MKRIIWVCIVGAVCVGGYFAIMKSPPPTKRVAYQSHTGTAPQLISLPLATSNSPKMMPDEDEVACERRQLIEVVGLLDGDLKKNPPFVFADFIAAPQGKEPVSANSAIGEVGAADGDKGSGKYRVLINAPSEPGHYTMRIRWGESGIEARREFTVK